MFILEVTATISMNFQKKLQNLDFTTTPPPPQMTFFQLLSLNYHILVNMLEKIKRLKNCVILDHFEVFLVIKQELSAIPQSGIFETEWLPARPQKWSKIFYSVNRPKTP